MDENCLTPLDRGQRHSTARELMSEAGLDALLLTGGPNLAYLTGATGMLEGQSGSRPVLYLLPATGDPVLIAHVLSDDTLDIEGVQASVRTYERLSSLPARELAQCLDAADLVEGRIGVEFGPETTLSVPAGEFLSFTEAHSDTEFVDAQPLLVEMRRRKSPAEVERIERACEITAAAYQRTFDSISAGTTGAEVESLVCSQMLELGGRSPWAFVTHGPGTYEETASGGGAKAVGPSDMVWIDGGCSVDGYYADFSRAGVVGGPTAEQQAAHEHIHRITQAVIDTIEPGVQLSVVARQAEREIDALTCPITSRLSRQAGRIGHALGLQVTELPSLSPSAEQAFESGMVVTVEPAFATEYGTFHLEENVVVTESGARKLTPDDSRLRSL